MSREHPPSTMEQNVVDFTTELEFVANINEFKDCLMSQDETDPEALWFNIDVPKGHGLRAGDRVRVIVQRA
jgi:hypothetical protein